MVLTLKPLLLQIQLHIDFTVLIWLLLNGMLEMNVKFGHFKCMNILVDQMLLDISLVVVLLPDG